MKKVLITGANGLLGQKLTPLLANRSAYEVIATSKGINRNLETEGYKYVSLDITDFTQLSNVFETYKPDVVINTAAMTNVDACELNPEECKKVNVHAIRYLCGLCKENGTKLIHVSTDFVFDGKSGPYAENAVASPLSMYGNSKLESEKLVQNSGIDYAIVRTVLVYGYTPNLTRTNIVLWVKSSLEQLKKITVVDDQVRSPTLSEDLADGIVSILAKDKKGIYHISGAEQMSILDLAYKVADFWKLDKSFIQQVSSTTLNQPAPRPPITGFIILKAQTELGYMPRTFLQGLELMKRQMGF